MRFNPSCFVVLCVLGTTNVRAQIDNLGDLIGEVKTHNPELEAAGFAVDAARARENIAGTLDPPELKYTRDEMPGFRFIEAAGTRISLMQPIRFPTKLSRENDIARIGGEHARHERSEMELRIVAQLKSFYAELWYIQQSILLHEENTRLLEQFVSIARTRFGVGDVPLQDVLKAGVELTKLENAVDALRRQERITKAMMMTLLGRRGQDTLHAAFLPDTVSFKQNLDEVLQWAARTRPVLMHDSLAVQERLIKASLASAEYLPDLSLELEYVTNVDDFKGWSFSVGMTLPFMPWTLGSRGAAEEEAAAGVEESAALLHLRRAMVEAGVRESYLKAESAYQQTTSYVNSILPQARQSLQASLTAYQSGRTDFLMLLDAYRSLIDLSLESLMFRMQFEQSLAELERQAGVHDFTIMEKE